MSRKLAIAILLSSLGQGTALGGQTVAVIDTDLITPDFAEYWCWFLEQHGHPCTAFPTSGPTGPLSDFDVVIDMSEVWTDPDGELVDLMMAGKTVITWGRAPLALGINSNPTVQAWIGANQYSGGTEELVTTISDPLLGEISPGTDIYDALSFFKAVRNSSGHPHAQVLAVWAEIPNPKPIGIMRNFWGNGVSVYLTDAINPGGNELRNQIVLNAVRIQQLIPTTSTWGMLILVLGVVTAGTLVLRRRSPFGHAGLFHLWPTLDAGWTRSCWPGGGSDGENGEAEDDVRGLTGTSMPQSEAQARAGYLRKMIRPRVRS